MLDEALQSANEQAYLFIRARILDGTYKAGELISEGEVAEAIGKSRTPVREAFLRLQSETFLRLFPKRGALVTTVTPEEAEDVLEARALIESWSAQRLARLGKSALQDLVGSLRIEIERQRAAVDADDNVEFQESDRQFHVLTVAAAGNKVFAEIYSGLRDRQLRIGIASVYGGEGRATEILTQHAGIIDALANRDASTLRQRLVEHLDATRSAIGLKPGLSEPLRRVRQRRKSEPAPAQKDSRGRARRERARGS
jgi:DNA-binding GntR family transcriptional regulator